MINSDLNVIDLFCGCGGFGLGAHMAGFKTVLAVDIDQTLSSAYKLNFPDTIVREYDIAKISSEKLLKDCNGKKISGIIGGPPCQGFSTIGRRDIDDPRNQLIGHYFDHILNISPDFFVMENVPGLMSKASLPVLLRHLKRVSELYSILGPLILDASEFGAATTRRRVVVIGYKPDAFEELTMRDIEEAKIPNKVSVRDAIHDLPKPIVTNDNSYGWAKLDKRKKQSTFAKKSSQFPTLGIGNVKAIQKLKNGYVSGFTNTIHSADVSERYSKVLPGKADKISKSKRLEWGGLCPTLRAGTGSDRGSYQAVRPIHPELGRVITVREAARLQGFPDWYLFHPTKWHSFRMIGNSVSPIFSEKILSILKCKYRYV